MNLIFKIQIEIWNPKQTFGYISIPTRTGQSIAIYLILIIKSPLQKYFIVVKLILLVLYQPDSIIHGQILRSTRDGRFSSVGITHFGKVWQNKSKL